MGERAHKRQARPLPSDAELRILRQLWLEGEQSVREVHERLEAEWPVGYTTVLKLLQRMLTKGLVTRSEDGRSHRYRARAAQQSTERRLVRELADRLFGGSVSELVQAALPATPASEADLDEIRELVERLEGKR